MEEQTAAPVNKALLSIDYTSTSSSTLKTSVLSNFLENIESSDYLQRGDVGFKKPKV